MKIAIASDHGGFELKESVKAYLLEKGYEVKDFGTNSTESCDYPDYIYPASLAVSKGEADFGVVLCTTGVGVSIVANKVKGIRCALAIDTNMARLAREHNHANVIAMGGNYVSKELANQIIDVFLTTECLGGRHDRRVNKILEIEEK